MSNFLLEAFVLEAVEPTYYTCLWLLNNNYSLQMYSHAAKLAFM